MMNGVNALMDGIANAQAALQAGHLDDTDSLLNLLSMNREYVSTLQTTTTGTYADARAMADLAQE